MLKLKGTGFRSFIFKASSQNKIIKFSYNLSLDRSEYMHLSFSHNVLLRLRSDKADSHFEGKVEREPLHCFSVLPLIAKCLLLLDKQRSRNAHVCGLHSLLK